MMDSIEDVVRGVVARHLDVDDEDIAGGARLRDDLHLDPLDLVLIALRLEERVKTEFPIQQLESVETVADIAGLVESMQNGGFDESIFTLDEPPSSSRVRARHGGRPRRSRYGSSGRAGLDRSGERVSSRSR